MKKEPQLQDIPAPQLSFNSDIAELAQFQRFVVGLSPAHRPVGGEQQQAVALARQDARKQIRQLLAVTHSKSAAEAVMQSLEGMELARLYQYKDALRRDFSRQCAAQLHPGEHAPLDSFRM